MAATETSAAASAAASPVAPDAKVSRSRFKGRLLIWVPAAVIILLMLACFIGPVVFRLPPPVGGSVLESALPPGSPGHLLGTDINGNDVLSRLLHGGRSSLIVGIVVNVIGLTIGGSVGAISAYLGGRADSLIMRTVDVFIAFPSLVLIVVLAQVLGQSLPNTILALTVFSIPAVSRVSRAATLQVMSMPFLQAAELSGSSTWRILRGHIVPNITPQLTTFAMLGMALVVVTEGALSFLGLGIPAPRPSWGNMIYDAQQSMSATPLLVLWPALALLVTVLAFNLLGENIRDEVSSR